MKKILVVIFMLVVLGLSANAQVSTKISTDADVRVSFVNQEPDPTEPGKYVDVRIKFENNGSEQAENIVVELLPEYPFSLDPGISPVEKLGALHARQLGEIAAIIKYKVRVDENAVEGENELKLRYKIDNGGWIELDTFMVDVRTLDAILSIESVNTGESIVPGEDGVLKINLKNMADSLLKDIKVNLNLGSVPLAPIGSTNEKTLYQLDAKESYYIEFNLIAEPDAESKIYKVPLRLEYFDELGTKYFKNQTIGITIGSKPDLSITLDSSDIFEADKSGEIVVKVVNKGVTDIKFMNIELLESDDYRILSNSESYLGNIDSDDFETADFQIFVEKSKENSIEVPFSIEYKDANNNDFKEDISLNLNLYSGQEAKKLGLKEGNKLAGFIIVIVIVAAGLYFYRKKRKKKK